MEKLSRKDRYQNTRANIEESARQSREAKAAPDSLNAPKESVHTAAPAAAPGRIRRAAPGSAKAHRNPTVMEDLLGEVNEYNLAKGEVVSEDPQMQILHDLAESASTSSKRKRHLEEMEKNESAGGTTRNLYSTDLSNLANRMEKEQSVKQPLPVKPVQEDENDESFIDLSLFETVKPKAKPVKVKNAQQEENDTEPKKARKPFFQRKKKLENEAGDSEKTIVDQFEDLDSYDDTDAPLAEEDVILNVKRARIADFRPNAGDPALHEEDEIEDDFDDDEYEYEQEDEYEMERAARKAEKARRKAEKKAAKAKRRQQRHADYDEPEDDVLDDELNSDLFDASSNASNFDEEDKPLSKTAKTFMIICTILLLVFIALTVFWMFKLGIF